MTSLVIHAAAAVAYVTVHGPARATAQPHIDSEPVRVSLDHLPDLALPVSGATEVAAQVRRAVKQRRRATAPPPQPQQAAVVATTGPREQVAAEPRQASQRPGVTLVVRLDRARESPVGARLATMLSNLPEGRDLLGGTGVDMLSAFDALLVGTPDPADARATVLVARHHLQTADLRAALDRAAVASHRVLGWRDDARFPFGQRRAAVPRPGASPDNRLFILPEPGVVVVTTPSYLRLLFATPASGGDTADDDPWRSLPGQLGIDGEQPAPADAFVSLTVAGDRSVSISGLTGARAVTVAARATPEPVVTISVELTSDADAIRAEIIWPDLRHKLARTPLVKAADVAVAGDRARLTREGRRLRVDVPVSEAELLRLIEVVATCFGAPAQP